MRPQVVDELKWREALQKAGGANNANRLWPVQALGPKDLLARKEAQVLSSLTCSISGANLLVGYSLCQCV